MENITAFFKNRSNLDEAAHTLREQGAIDIRIHPDSEAGSSAYLTPLTQSALTEDESANGHGYVLQVVVESSRSRQAEDTLAKFGGQL
ncbi:hypothetical protein N0M98_23450 [Paenibacillus doosanensis]|uniref:Uncharacterized protein n=1 Tax=Paenibacillus konkukensis TaxID=2020716 RepID=A0ABY4RPY6_9BACL|nr:MULTISPECIES: hypothetical protein [Paenibacillus]MCS7463086.1 hypothetical protein [Paenibacillus doosanensis]UQZ84522.1 hypothetical protein SK3146_03777 [Paenibacillus konkukensis]